MHQTVARARFAVQNVKKLDSRGALLEDEVGKNVHRTVARARFHKKKHKMELLANLQRCTRVG